MKKQKITIKQYRMREVFSVHWQCDLGYEIADSKKSKIGEKLPNFWKC